MRGRGRTFRIFVSSTFSDLKEERNALQDKVFPRLRDLCMQHSCRFQAIDLRWGVREEASLDQQTIRICFEEIKRCQKVTPRPNFIILLGDRYGWRPLPYEIQATEFEEILTHITDEKDAELLGRWYRRDNNAVPPVYDLQPRAEKYSERAIWEPVERRLRSILLEASRDVALSEEDQSKYRASATEQEIRRGALTADNASDHVFCFFRSILVSQEDGSFLPINKSPLSQSFQEFVDLNPEGNLDRNAWNRLAALKNRLEDKMPNNVFEYKAKWIKNGLSYDHLNQFCEKVLESLTGVIKQEIADLEEIDPLDEEIDAHEAFGKERTKAFTGRDDILAAITDYIEGASNYPYVINGESGSGKTAVMARMVEGATELLPHAKMLSRFIGATPESSNGRSLLESLCRQIYRDFGFEEQKQKELADISSNDEEAQQKHQDIEQEYEIPADFEKLSPTFRKFLTKIPAQEKLILFIDALDQLSDHDPARNLTWLPQGLTENIKVVVSTLPGKLFSLLEKILPAESFKALEPMVQVEGSDLLTSWLRLVGRTLQDSQTKEVLQKFNKTGLPLYLKLVFNEACRWKSYAKQVDLSLDIPGIIQDFFERLSLPANHGSVLVPHSMGYLAAAKNGLTEDELLDVLSLDEAVFTDFADKTHHEYVEDRLPAVIWLRLYHELEPYLTERSADGMILLSFYHKQLAEVANDLFLKDGVKQERHGLLAGYFEKQPLWHEGQEKRTPNVRKVSELPYQQTYGELWDAIEKTLCDLYFIEAKCAAGRTYELIADYNAVLGLLPEARCERERELRHEKRLRKYIDDLIAFSKGEIKHLDIIPSIDPWNEEKIRQLSESVINNSNRLNRIRGFYRFINAESSVLEQFGCQQSFCLQHAYNSARNGPVAAAADSLIAMEKRGAMLLQLKDNRSKYVSNFKISRDLVGKHRILNIDISADGKKAITGCSDGIFTVWDIEKGLVKSFETPKESYHFRQDQITDVSISVDGKKAMLGYEDGKIQFWDLESGEKIWNLYEHKESIQSVSITPDCSKAVSGSSDKSVRIWNLENGETFKTFQDIDHVYNFLSDGKNISVIRGGKLCILDIYDEIFKKEVKSFPNIINCKVSITPDGRRAAVTWLHFFYLINIDKDVCMNSIEGFPEAKLYPGDDTRNIKEFFGRITHISITADGKKAITGGVDRTIRMWDLENARCLKTFWDHPGEIMALAITPDGRVTITGSHDGVLRVWDSERGESKGSNKGHLTYGAECLNFTPDARHVVSGSIDGTIREWQSIDGKYERIFRKCIRPIYDLDFSPDGKKIAYGREPGYVIIADYKDEKDTDESISNYEKYDIEDVRLEANNLWTSSVSFSPDGSMIASCGADDSSELKERDDAHTIKVWDFVNFEIDNPLMLRGHKDTVQSFVFTPDGKRIISGSSDKSIRIWNITTRKALIVKGYNSPIHNMDICLDGRKAVFCSVDGTLCLLEISKHKSLKEINDFADGYPIWAKFTPDGKHLFTLQRGIIRLWDLNSWKCLSILANKRNPFTIISNIESSGVFSIGTITGKILLFNMLNVSVNHPIVTCKRLWRHSNEISFYDGHWAKNIRANCPWCHKCFIVKSIILDLINKISCEAKISAEQSPCLNLPDEAWEEPGLLSECPHCHKPLKFNPFIVDNSERY
ncbi:MAG TPA: DUF4062 domain-containing protein [Desulfobacteraceae bacterium]|mgnify:CR=1 FL=1|nr:DUF4062 domain-containing protein [Desulfobacteraceae bacterium]HPJ67025.1 DUF4062 domain-containing protein [Desulfobacteraceae bacterium]HPQ27291.1 DUF4062 domain-containing protein [Desulfobacteraceae bacterium]